MNYYGSCLDSKEKNFYLKIIDAIKSHQSSVKSANIVDGQSFLRCVSAVQKDYPEFFYVDFSRLLYAAHEDGWEYRPNYIYSVDEAIKKERQINQVVQQITDEISKRHLTSIYQICDFLHSYLVHNCSYDHEALENPGKRQAYSIEGPFLYKTGVCQGIMSAYQLLCKRSGIDTIEVKGEALKPDSNEYAGHGWNIVRIGNNAAHIDVTLDMSMTLPEWPVRHDYFFLSDADIKRDHRFSGCPVCKELHSGYYEKNQSQFDQLVELDSFIEKELLWDIKKGGSGVYYFQFKMTNPMITEREINNYLGEAISRTINKKYMYILASNIRQSVYSCKVEIQ